MIIADDDAPGTLGGMREARWRLWAHCRNPQCWRNLDIDIKRAVERFGADAPVANATFARVVCERCRRRDIHWTFRAPAVPIPGLTHLTPAAPTDPKPMPVWETDMERYRRVSAETVASTPVNPGEVESIDDPKRPARELPADYPGLRYSVFD